MRSKFAIRGHPLHPALVAVPIGLLLWALVADLIYMSTGAALWYWMSFWTGVAAIVSALVAAVPGLGDYLTMARYSSARRVARIHMIMNLVTVFLFVVAAILARGVDPATGDGYGFVTLLHLLGIATVSVAGWLGGDMVFRHGLAVHEEALGPPRERAHERHEETHEEHTPEHDTRRRA